MYKGGNKVVLKFIHDIKEDIMSGFLPKMGQTKSSCLSRKIYMKNVKEIQNLKIEQLYVHIPFCPSKCSFCSFYVAGIRPLEAQLRDYAYSVIQEIKIYKELLRGKVEKGSINTIYFGGGTPSLLNADLLMEILRTLIEEFSEDMSSSVEITVEMRPEHYKQMLLFYENFIQEYGDKQFKVRFSVGIQTLDGELLKHIGRGYQPYELVVDLLKEFKLRDILFNFDLMYLLPEQDLEKTLKTVNQFVEWGVPQISLYRTKYVEGTPIYEKQDKACISKELEFKQEIFKCLKENHYKTVDNQFFYLDEEFHQAVFVLGFGAGAFSDLRNMNQFNTINIEYYLSCAKKKIMPIRSFRILFNKERMFDHLKICIFKGKTMKEEELMTIVSKKKIEKLVARGLLIRHEGNYISTSDHKKLRWLIFSLMQFRDKISMVYLVVQRRVVKKFSKKNKILGSGLEPPIAVGGPLFDLINMSQIKK